MSSAGGDDDSVIDLVDSDSGEFEEGLTGSSADDAASYDSGSSLLDSHGSDSGRPAIFSPSPGYGGFYEQNRIPPTPAELCYLRCQYNPLKPSLVHAILASQPPLPPAAAAGLPMQEHRGASGLRLQCSDVPTLECNRVIPPRAATEEAFQHPVLLGSLVFPLEPWQSTGSGRSTAFQEDLNRFASAFRSGEISDGFLQVLWANKAWTAASDCRPVEDTDSGPLIPRGLPYYRSRTQRNHHLVLAACLSGPSVGSSLANSIARGRGVTNSTDGIQDLTRRIGLATLEPTDATFPVLNRLSEMSLDGLVDLSFRLVVPDGWETEVPGPHIGFGGPVGSEQKKAKRTKKKGAQSSGKGSGEASVGGVERGGSGGGWKLRVEVLMLPALTEELLVDSSKLSDEMAANPGRSRSAYVQTRGGRLVLLLQDLLLLGKGLWLGPDCDGLLNFCDPNGGLELLTEEERKVVEAHYEPMQLFSPCGATPPRSLPNKRSRVGNSDNTGAEEVGAKLILVPKPFQLPGWLFSLSQVLGTGTLPEESPPAHVPPGVCVQPKPFQLQVMSLRRFCVPRQEVRAAWD